MHETLTMLLANKKGADQHVHPHSPKSAHLSATNQRVVVALAATTRWYSISVRDGTVFLCEMVHYFCTRWYTISV